jgi:hypothetical protein
LLGAIALSSMSGCGARASGSDTGRTSTADPARDLIDDDAITGVNVGHRVQVMGGKGAVPSEARVQVVNLGTQQREVVTAAKDGSFSVVISGEAGDSVSIDVESGDETARVTLKDVQEPAYECVMRHEQEVKPYVCDALGYEASCELNDVVAAASECSEDTDCVELELESSCFPCTAAVFVAKSERSNFQQAFAEVESGICSALALGCGSGEAECDLTDPQAPGCVVGSCSGVTGCDASVYAARRSIDKSRPMLADGCETDADCRVELIAPCDWACLEPVLVSKRGLYGNFLDFIERLCARTPAIETCVARTCESAQTPSAVCNAGKCEPT